MWTSAIVTITIWGKWVQENREGQWEGIHGAGDFLELPDLVRN